MGAVKKILYAVNLEPNEYDINTLKSILPLQKMGMDEIVFLQTVPYNEWNKNLSGQGIETEFILKNKFNASIILDTAENQNASLIVLDLKNRKNNSERRSTIKKLIKKSGIPFLVLNNKINSQDGKGIFSRTIFATDWSNSSERAFKYFLKYKNILGETEIVNVVNEMLTLKDIQMLKYRLFTSRKACLDLDIDAESHVYAGGTASEIVTASKDYDATSIFIGRKSETSIFKILFKKSTSLRIAEKAEIPVLIIP